LLQRLFHDFTPQHNYDYACVGKPLQLRVSLRFASPRYDAYCKILVKKDGLVKGSNAQENAQLRRNEAYFSNTPDWAGSLAFHKVVRKGF